MKHVIDEYGSMIITFAAVVLVIAALIAGFTGLRNGLASSGNTVMSSQTDSAYASDSALNKYAEGDKLDIALTGTIGRGVETNLSDLFSVMNGKTPVQGYTYKLISLKTDQGEDALNLETDNNGTKAAVFDFSDPKEPKLTINKKGVYYITVRAIGEYSVKRTFEIAVQH